MKRTTNCSLIAFLLVWSSLASIAAAATLETEFEQSGGKKTPDNEEFFTWLDQLASGTEQISIASFGTSAQGRPLAVVVADESGRTDAAQHLPREDHVVVMVQACIHAGETCGKDAGAMILRDLAEDPELAAELLRNVTIVFLPVFNVDGHARFGPYNRINQNGPEEMGWRVNAENLNLNRDYLKADTPEMRAWLGLFNRWSPDFFIDIHSTDGADYQYPITYGLETRGNLEQGLTEWTVEYRELMTSLMADDGFPMAPYVSFRDWHDPRSGLKDWAAGPRFSQGYAAVRNRPGLLIEAHMLKDYATRVEATRLLLLHTLHWLNAEATRLRSLVAEADRFTASPEFRAEPFPLRFELGEGSRPFAFLGFEYEKVTSEITGGEWFRFSDVPTTLDVRFFDDLQPSVTADLPEAYIVPVEWAQIVDRLELHGVRFERLREPAEVSIRTWRFHDAKWRERPYEGRHPVTFTAEPHHELRMFPAGSAVVDMNQPLARVAAHLLEPLGPDSLVQWGFFDAAFERVEYVESYVIEEMIPGLLAADPGMADRLAERKAADPEFAADPWAIRYWFYEQTPYYDHRTGIYPVGSVDDPAIVKQLPVK